MWKADQKAALTVDLSAFGMVDCWVDLKVGHWVYSKVVPTVDH